MSSTPQSTQFLTVTEMSGAVNDPYDLYFMDCEELREVVNHLIVTSPALVDAAMCEVRQGLAAL